VALVNESGSTATVSTTASAVGLGSASSYTLRDLWAKTSRTTSGAISASVPSHGTVLYRVTPVGATTGQEAETGTLAGAAASAGCSTCSGGAKVRFIGNGTANTATLTVNAAAAGSRQLRITYELSGSRSFFVSVNGGTATEVALTGTSWSAPATATTTITLAAGSNTVRFFNTGAWAPDLDRIDIG
jgi:hypothetical protein